MVGDCDRSGVAIADESYADIDSDVNCQNMPVKLCLALAIAECASCHLGAEENS